MSRRTLSAVALAVAALPGAPALAESPPDLRLEWQEPGGARDEAPPVRGRAGEVVRLDYRLTNVGESPAAAVELATHTTLGPAGAPVELRPGPDPGEERRRSVDLRLAIGLREVCIDARLRSGAEREPREPTPENNRICRAVEVAAATTAAPVVRPPNSSIPLAARTSAPTYPEIAS